MPHAIAMATWILVNTSTQTNVVYPGCGLYSGPTPVWSLNLPWRGRAIMWHGLFVFNLATERGYSISVENVHK